MRCTILFLAVCLATCASAQPPAPPDAPKPDSAPSPTSIADQQLHEQESQRVLGILPMFNVSYVPNAASLTSRQKFSLAARTVTDPVTIADAFIESGLREVADDHDERGFGWGPEGYMRRTGAAYLDTVNSNLIGRAILPSVLHQDPRYFRLGHGSVPHRFLYAIAANFICKHDSTGRWEPNYSKVGGNIASGALSNLYYPARNAGVGETLTNGVIVTVEGAIGLVFNEFWPDLSRKVLHRDPTRGLDAQQSIAEPQSLPSPSH